MRTGNFSYSNFLGTLSRLGCHQVDIVNGSDKNDKKRNCTHNFHIQQIAVYGKLPFEPGLQVDVYQWLNVILVVAIGFMPVEEALHVGFKGAAVGSGL